MPYVTSVERLARAEGRKEGQQEGREEGLVDAIAVALEAKFGAAGKRLVSRVRALHDAEKLRASTRTVISAQTLDEVKIVLRS